jgi:serine/threonine-protein kinase HipA
VLLIDRLFRRRGLNAARIGALERLAYIGNNAMGAMSFEPVMPEGKEPQVHIPLDLLAAEVQEVLHGDGGEFLQSLLLVGGLASRCQTKGFDLSRFSSRHFYNHRHAGLRSRAG